MECLNCQDWGPGARPDHCGHCECCAPGPGKPIGGHPEEGWGWLIGPVGLAVALIVWALWPIVGG